DRPVLIGRTRLGPDLANIGRAAPAEEEAAPVQPAPAGSPGGSPAPAHASPAPRNASPPPANAPAPPASHSSRATAASPSQPAASPSPAASFSETPVPYSAACHHLHLYSPRSLNLDSNMPAYKFLYEKRPIGGQRSADALQLRGDEAPG